MKTTVFTALCILAVLFAAAEADNKKCKCQGKRGPRGARGPKGKKGPPGPPGGAGSCKLVHKSGPSNKKEHDTGELNFAIPILSIGSTCPEGYTAVSCDCHVNSFKNGNAQVKTKIIGWGTFEKFCLCNNEYLPGVAETVEVSAQVNCVKLECN